MIRARNVSGWPSPWALRRDAMTSSRIAAGAVELPGIRQASGLVFEAFERVGVVGAQLRLRQRQRLLEELQRPVVLAGVGIAEARLLMLASVSGWSGPSFAFSQCQRLLVELQRPVDLAGVGIAVGEVVHAGERVGVVGAELRLRSASVSSRSFSARSSWPAAA